MYITVEWKKIRTVETNFERLMTKRVRAHSNESIPELEPISESWKPESIRSSGEEEDQSESSDYDRNLEDEHFPSASQRDEGEVFMEPFSLKNEEASGSIDAEGNFVQTKEQQIEERDPWLDTVDEDASVKCVEMMEKSRKNAELTFQYWSSAEQGNIGPDEPPDNYMLKLVKLLRPCETPRSAMERCLGKTHTSGTIPSFKSTVKAKRKTEKPTLTTNEKDLAAFESITEATDALTAIGFHSILQESREFLQERLRKIVYEYIWKDQRDSEIFGPFSLQALLEWNKQGCFNTHPIQVRYAGSKFPWRDFSPPMNCLE